MLKGFKSRKAFVCSNRTLTEALFFIVEFRKYGLMLKEGRRACGRWLVLRGVKLVIKVFHGI